MPRYSLVLAAPLVFAACSAQSANVATAAPDAPRGYLMIVGGGSRPPSMREQFVQLAGGPERARIVVLPMASADAEAAGASEVRALQRLGADARSIVLTREQAMDPASARLLDGVTGIWMPGGVQSRLTAVLAGTPVERAMHERYRAGAIIGGTSAGAAVMTTPMLTGSERRPGGARPLPEDSRDANVTIDRDNVVTAPGFALLPNAIVDQHFVRRRRHNRLISIVLENPTMVGAGIDEGTALLVGPDGLWRVIGESVVVVYDAREAAVTPVGAGALGAAGMRMHVLPEGAVFDPRTGRATLAQPAPRDEEESQLLEPALN